MAEGFAGEDMEIGQAISRGVDGYWYLARGGGYSAVAAAKIKKGDKISDRDRDGYFEPIAQIGTSLLKD